MVDNMFMDVGEQSTQRDSRYVEIGDLPSDYLRGTASPYPFTKLMVRGITVTELKLIAKAWANKDIYFTIRAVGNCINVDVNVLTIPDFYYLLYHLRIESYPSTPVYMPWVCDEPRRDDTGNLIDGVCGHENLSRLTNAQKQLSVAKLSECVRHTELAPELEYPRVSLMPSIDYYDKKSSDHALFDVAKWVRHGTTIEEKMAFLEAQPDLKLWETAMEADSRLRYGVREAAKVACERCGADRYYKIAISAATFLPSDI